MKHLTIQFKIRRLKYFLKTLLCFCVFNFFACKKNDIPIKNIFIETNLDLTYTSIKEIVCLPDNSFWIHYENQTKPFIVKIEHYDENFNLLDKAFFKNIRFGNFVVNKNNDIVVLESFLCLPLQL